MVRPGCWQERDEERDTDSEMTKGYPDEAEVGVDDIPGFFHKRPGLNMHCTLYQ